jgi:hypothetical protein
MRNPIVRLLFADPESPQPSNPRLFAQDVIRIKEFSGLRLQFRTAFGRTGAQCRRL